MSTDVLTPVPAGTDGATQRLARPVRIADQQWPEGTAPVLSICCAAYNHARFIRECLDGFLMQETTFPVEILLHDDASTDGTADIIREYEARYPQAIKPVYQKENQYSKGTGDLFSLKRATGDYLAVCEGDDYWTDPVKLQTQVDFLDRNPDYVICYHDAKIVDEAGKVVSESKLSEDCKKDFSSAELMKGAWTLNLSRVARNPSKLARKEPPPQPVRILNSDIIWTVLLGKYGKGKYLPEIRPAVYRLHPGSIWSSLDYNSQQYENFNSFLHIYLLHVRTTGKDFAVEFLFERVFPIFMRMFQDTNPACALRRDKEAAEQRARELEQRLREVMEIDHSKSYTYRVGAVILWPLKKLRSLWRAVNNRAAAR